jgi:methylated-DNA-[protein]-cysteine S-methyltransferase
MDEYNSFEKRCYELLKLVPAGKVTTYNKIARALDTKAWRAVGGAMAKNKNLFVIPCHRVVRKDGTIGEYALGSDKKARLLANEGVEVSNGKIKDLDKHLYRFGTRRKRSNKSI